MREINFGEEFMDLVKEVDKIDQDAACYLMFVVPEYSDYEGFRCDTNILEEVMIWFCSPQGHDYWENIDDQLPEKNKLDWT